MLRCGCENLHVNCQTVLSRNARTAREVAIPYSFLDWVALRRRHRIRTSAEWRDAWEQDAGKKSRVLSLTEETQSFVFEGICETPIPSLLRGFSAPVRLNYKYDPTELQTLMVSDSDGFNRWNAGQQLAISIIESQLGTWHERQKAELSSLLKDAFVGVLDRVAQ